MVRDVCDVGLCMIYYVLYVCVCAGNVECDVVCVSVWDMPIIIVMRCGVFFLFNLCVFASISICRTYVCGGQRTTLGISSYIPPCLNSLLLFYHYVYQSH